MRNEYLLVLPVEEMPVGATYACGASLPLHCTVMGWFSLGHDLTIARLRKELASVARGVSQGAIALVSHRREFFGPNGDVPVHILFRCEVLNLLHTQLLCFLAYAQCHPLPEMRWMGAGYRPHVSDCGARSFIPGAKHVPESLVLVRRGKDNIKRVVHTYPFGT